MGGLLLLRRGSRSRMTEADRVDVRAVGDRGGEEVDDVVAPDRLQARCSPRGTGRAGHPARSRRSAPCSWLNGPVEVLLGLPVPAAVVRVAQPHVGGGDAVAENVVAVVVVGEHERCRSRSPRSRGCRTARWGRRWRRRSDRSSGGRRRSTWPSRPCRSASPDRRTRRRRCRRSSGRWRCRAGSPRLGSGSRRPGRTAARCGSARSRTGADQCTPASLERITPM